MVFDVVQKVTLEKKTAEAERWTPTLNVESTTSVEMYKEMH